VTTAAVSQLMSAAGGYAGFLGDIGRNTVFGAIINAVRTDTNSNLLATPHIVTLDNSEARFLVGQDVPLTTGEALSQNFDNRFRTVQRQEVGIMLTVTPQINASGEVKLYIGQEVSSVAGPVNSRSADLIINRRRFDTVMTAGDGQIVAIGGLLSDDERRTLQRVPLLSDIPLLGELFRSRSRSRTRTNLMVFIRPTIIDGPSDAAAMTAQRYNYIRNQQLLRNPEAEPEIDLLVRDYLGTTPPVAAPRNDDVIITGQAELRTPPGPIIETDIPPASAAPPPPSNYQPSAGG
jgi:general secretion pathway protein D